MKRISGILGVIIGGLLTGPGLAQAGTIYTCVTTANGAMRMVSNATSCKKGEDLVAWNQVGAQGPAGPQGAQGSIGPQGPQGQSGSVNVVVRQTSMTVTIPPGEDVSIVSLCLAGETAVGGGPSAIPGPPVFATWSTAVFDGGPRSGWQAAFQNGGEVAVTVTPRTMVLCAPGSMTLE